VDAHAQLEAKPKVMAKLLVDFVRALEHEDRTMLITTGQFMRYGRRLQMGKYQSMRVGAASLFSEKSLASVGRNPDGHRVGSITTSIPCASTSVI
jgi:hypothetical protein